MAELDKSASETKIQLTQTYKRCLRIKGGNKRMTPLLFFDLHFSKPTSTFEQRFYPFEEN